MRGNQRRSQRAETIEAFPETPLRAMELLCSSCDVVRTGIPEDVVHGIYCGNIPSIFANDYSKLGFIVCLPICRLVRDYQRRVRSPKACRWLKKSVECSGRSRFISFACLRKFNPMHRIVPTSDLARGGSSLAIRKFVDVGLTSGDSTDDPVKA
jgi:hypothetical protein